MCLLRQNKLIKKHISYLVPRLHLVMIKVLPSEKVTDKPGLICQVSLWMSGISLRAVSINTHPRAEATDTLMPVSDLSLSFLSSV